MFVLTTVAILISIAHVAAIYIGTDVLRVDYKTMMALVGLFGIAAAIAARALEPYWDARLSAALHRESTDEVSIDALLMAGIIIAGSVISNMLITRRYGIAGWLGALGVSTLVNFLV